MRAWASYGLRLIVVLAVVFVATGCGEKQQAVVVVKYTLDPDPAKGLPAGLTKVAIAPAELGPATDAQWSDMTADVIQNLVEKSRESFGTQLRIADRVESKKVFAESDLNAAGLAGGQGGAPAKLLDVQAFITSKVDIKVEMAKGKGRTISGLSAFGYGGHGWGGGGGSVDSDEVDVAKKSVMAQASFKLIDAKTGEALISHSDNIQSTEETKVSPFFGSGKGEAGLSPTDQIAGSLIERVAREFVAKMIPCEVEHELAVEGSSKGAAEGVKMLRADQYAEALSSFKSALAENPEDHQAAFGAGVASEVLGQPEQALDYYRKAFAMQNEPTYGKAKDRLNQDSKHIRKGK